MRRRKTSPHLKGCATQPWIGFTQTKAAFGIFYSAVLALLEFLWPIHWATIRLTEREMNPFSNYAVGCPPTIVLSRAGEQSRGAPVLQYLSPHPPGYSSFSSALRPSLKTSLLIAEVQSVQIEHKILL